MSKLNERDIKQASIYPQKGLIGYIEKRLSVSISCNVFSNVTPNIHNFVLMLKRI